jgi:hypothetical protein
MTVSDSCWGDLPVSPDPFHGPFANDPLREWAILDSNQGPPPYQSGALTD